LIFFLSTYNSSDRVDEGRVNDPNWDGIWKSEANITTDGWIATIAIPFSTLNFKTSENTTLGINFSRFIRRKNEEDLWQAYLRIYGLTRVSEGGQLTGLEDIGSGRLLVIKPYVLGLDLRPHPGPSITGPAMRTVKHPALYSGPVTLTLGQRARIS
jgi:hypothetical protein